MAGVSLGIGLLNQSKVKRDGGRKKVAPGDIALSAAALPEDAAIGSVVATLSATGTAPVSFAKVSDPDGKFAVSGSELVLAAALDYETKTSHQVTLRATNVAGSPGPRFTAAPARGSRCADATHSR
jgi:hypothetical protein